MTEAIIVAIITGGLTLLGTIVTVWASAKRQTESFKTDQAVMNTRLENLTEEVRKHNGFAERIPVIEEKIKVCNNRISDLEYKIDKRGE